MTDRTGTEFEMRVLSAWELLRLRNEARERECADEDERAVYANSALLAESLRRGGKPIFNGAEAVLRTLGAGEINCLVEQYVQLEEKRSFAFAAGENAAFDESRFARMKEGERTSTT